MEQLDQSQRAFCEAPAGNVRLLAPAGCGKTLCLLFRCKHLTETSKQSVRFLIVTFTRAAQQELSIRLREDSNFSKIQDVVEVRTLNSWGNRRIKNFTDFPKTITPGDDFHFAMRNQLQPVWRKHESVRNAIQSSNRWKRSRSPRSLMDAIDAFKTLGFDHIRHSNYEQFSGHWKALEKEGLGWRIEAQCRTLVAFDVLDGDIFERSKNRIRREVYNAFFKFWQEATAYLIGQGTFTLEDQKYFAYLDERKNIEQGRLLSGAASYNHIFVDEFQDINPLDLALVKAIAERNRATITIAGDDDQAIFEWRGATPEYILDPDTFFGTDFRTYTLGVNYRSPANIVDHSQRLIQHNARRVHKQIQAASSNNARIEIRETDDISESLGYVYDIIQDSIEQGVSPSRVAIIGHNRSQIIPYQVYLASKDVPFCAAEDLQVFLSGTFDRLLKLLDIKANPRRRGQVVNDVLSMCDLAIQYRLNKADREKLQSYLRKCRPATLGSAIDALKGYESPLRRRKSEDVAKDIGDFVSSKNVSDSLMILSKSFEGLHRDFGKAEEDVFYTDPPFEQLSEFASSYGDDYDSFVYDIECAKDTLVRLPPFEEEGDIENLWRHPLHLMTATRAKGKEFDTVILLDVLSGIWPHHLAETPEQLEADRRLFYVAFTRAKERIVVLQNRNHGNAPSPYIKELGLSV